MIRYSFTRLGSAIQKAIMAHLSQEAYLVTYRKIMHEFQTEIPDRIHIQSGRAKLQDVFPNIGIEIQSRVDTWAATNFTKDLEYRFNITCGVKVASGMQEIPEGQLNQVELYIMALAEFTFEVLNEPIDAVQYLVAEDSDGTTLTTPFRIYDSMASRIAYGFLYNGAIRTAQLEWFGKVLRTGPDGGGQLGY